jgi:hypothetical protein
MCVCIDVYLRLRFSAVEEDTCFDTCLATCGGGYLSLSVEEDTCFGTCLATCGGGYLFATAVQCCEYSA